MVKVYGFIYNYNAKWINNIEKIIIALLGKPLTE